MPLTDHTRELVNKACGQDTGAEISAAIDAGDVVVLGTPGALGQWIKVTKTFADFAAAATTNDITIFAADAKTMVQAAVMQVTTTFRGGAIGAYTLSLGYTPPSPFADYFGNIDVFTATFTKNIIFVQSSLTTTPDNFQPQATIKSTATSTGANLNAATQGSVTFWLLLSELP